MAGLQRSVIPIDIIILQETWEIKFPNLLTIPGYQNIVYRTREGMRGGGVGIFVKTHFCFNTFWDIFKSLHDEHFPEITIKFNINKHKLNAYMTDELFEACNARNKLHKIYIKSKTLSDKD